MTKIKRIDIKNYRCISEANIDCVDDNGRIAQWTVLLGDNNAGKTTILKAIAGLNPMKAPFFEFESDKTKYIPAGSFLHKESSGSNFSVDCYFDQLRQVVIDDTLFNLSKWGYDESSGSVSVFIYPIQIYGYGVSRYPGKTSLSETSTDTCATLFSNNATLTNLEEWLMQTDYAAKSGNKGALKILQRIRQLFEGNLFPDLDDFKFSTSDTLNNRVQFKTKDGWFNYRDLGFGYQSMLSWVIDLCKQMVDRYPEAENPLHQSAVVLVDEIDLHLHPKWQREIITYLSHTFPNTQFIVTTHSPLVIQSMESVNLYRLSRNDNGIVVEKAPNSKFLGWSSQEILQDVMMMKDDVYTDQYQELTHSFDQGLDTDNTDQVLKAYHSLIEILHPENPTRRILEIQMSHLKRP